MNAPARTYAAALVLLALASVTVPAAARKAEIPPPADDRERLARLTAQVEAVFDTGRGGRGGGRVEGVQASGGLGGVN